MFANLFRNMPDVTKNLLILNIICFIAGWTINIGDEPLAVHFLIWYYEIDFFEPYQLISNMFMHADLSHILFNMIGVVIFGSQLERVWGAKKFFIFYFACGIGAAIAHQAFGYYQLHYLNEFPSPAFGASGSVFGLLTAFGLLFPNTELMLLFPPIPIKAKYFVLGYVAIELYLGYSMFDGDNVAHFAHLGGALIGFILVMIWRRDRRNFY